MFQPYEFYRTHSLEEPQTSKPKHEIYTLQFLFDKKVSDFKCPIHKAHLLAVTARKISQGLKCSFRIWKSEFRLVSADARWGGTRYEAIRVSAWEATEEPV